MGINNIYGEISWDQPNTLRNRVFLFCVNGKCMSGKIEEYQTLTDIQKVLIKVSFIEPSYFGNDIKLGNYFTIQEASKILAEGIITKISKT